MINDKKTKRQTELFNRWKKGDSEALKDMFTEMDKTIQFNVNKYANNNIGRNNVLIEAKSIVYNALPKYDPSKASLETFANSQLRGLQRFSGEFGNIGHIPEKRISMISGFKSTKERLKDELGYEPNAGQIADAMSIPVNEIERLETELRGEVIGSSSTFENKVSGYDREKDTLNMIYFNLSDKQRVLFEYMNGMNGKPQIKSNTELAKMTGMKTSSVSRMKKLIAREVEKYS